MKVKKHLCVIDDDKLYQFIIKKLIENQHQLSRLSFFNDGEEGIDFIKENLDHADNLPDVIFLDIHMPRLNGWGFLEEFIGLKPLLQKDIDIYMITASIKEADKTRADKYEDIRNFKVKPVTFADLEHILTDSMHQTP